VGEVSKDDVRVEAFAACEEANTAIGTALASGGFPIDVARTLTSIQNDLFDLAAGMSAPAGRGNDPDAGQDSDVRIVADHVAWVDRATEHYGAGLPELHGPVLPGGTLPAALLYQARVVVRRAERAVVRAGNAHPEDLNPQMGQYLNSVSSLLFVLARMQNTEHGDMRWRPLASITPPPAGAPEGMSQEEPPAPAE
jgi:cob(I)alamin adenosyltransferase